MNRHQEMNQDLLEKINKSIVGQHSKKVLRKSMSMKPGYKPSKDKKTRNYTPDMISYQNDLRALSNEIRSFNMNKTLFHSSKAKAKRVKFKTKFIDEVEIECYKAYFEIENEEENNNNTVDVPVAIKKFVKEKDQVLKPFNHKLNSNNESKVKCCVCNVF